MAFMLLVGSSAWAADALTKDLKVTGYKAVNLFDFQNKDYDGVVLSSFDQLPNLGVTAQNTVGDTYGNNNWYNDTQNNHGLRLQSGGGRWIQFKVDIKKDDYIIINGGAAAEAYEISMAGGESVAIAQASDYLCFKATENAEYLKLTAHRYNYLLQILIMTKDESAATASYTLNYINGSLTVKSVNGEMAVGATVPTEASFFVDDVKYYRGAGEPEGFTIAAEGGNNFSVKVRAAETYNYSLVSSLGETLASGSGIEGETVYVGYPRYQLKEGKFYEAATTSKEYRKPVVLSEDNVSVTVDYAEWNGANPVVFYAEGEDLDGFSTSVAINIPVRASQAKAGVAAEDVTITTLPAGKYKLHVGIFTSKSAYEGNVVKFGLGSAIFEASFVGVNLNETVSDEITVTGNSDVKFIAEGSWDGAQFDYIWIEKTGEAVTSYAIVYADGMVGGSVTGPVSAVEGEKVTLTVTRDDDYDLKTLTVTGAVSEDEINYDVKDYSFTMPAEDVKIFASFAWLYSIEYQVGMDYGEIGGNASAVAGEKVTVIVTPDVGCELEALKITCKSSGNEINYDVKDYSFTMPEEDIAITASFKRKAVYIETNLTKDFISLVSPATWKSENASPVGEAIWAAPQVTVAGNMYYMIENYVEGQAVKQATGGVMYNEITGLTPGLYTIELYGSAALTAGRGGMTTDFTEGDAASLSAVYLYAESNGEKVKKFIPCLIEDNFNNRGGEESIPTATLDNVEVGTDGKVKIGIYKEVGLTNWHIVQLKSVTAKVLASDLLAKAVEAAAAVKENDVPATLYAQIQQALITYDVTYETADEYLAAINVLNGLADEAVGYAPLAKVLNEGKGYKANVPAENPAIAAYDAAIADVKNAYDNAAVEDIPAAVAVIEDALPALAKAQTAPNSDMTRAIVNPAVNGVSGWTCERPKGGGGPELPAGGALEYWASSANPRTEAQFDYYQVIEGLPSGKYVVSVGMYNSLNGEEGAVFSPTCGVYASSGNDETAKLVDVEGTEFIPYTTEPVFVRDGKIRLGVKSAEIPVAARWFVADNFKLTLVEAIKTYPITYANGMVGGSVSGPVAAAAEEKVTLTVTPEEGYTLKTLKITCADSGNEINYDVKDYSFTMPEEGVHVFATFQPSSKVEIANEIATYCSLKALDFTTMTEVKAYIVSAFTPSTSEAVLTRVYDVPAGTGLVLIGENGSYEIPEGTGATVVSNLLKGVTSATVLNAVDETNTNFILTTGEYDLGFYPVLDGTTLAAGKAYLPLPTESLPLSAGAPIRFVFEDRGEATYINGVAIGYAGSKMEKGVYYNLNGQRVGRPTKAGIYILDGKKVYVK